MEISGRVSAVAPEHAAVVRGQTALDVELARLDALLGAHLARVRRRGRTPLHEAADGLVIEPSESEGLLAELVAAHRGSAVDDRAPIAPAATELPGLARAERVFGLDRFERDVVLLCLAVEIDARYARLIAFLNDHVQRARPTVGLAVSVLAPEAEQLARLQSFFPASPLMRHALLALDGEGPLATRALLFDGDWWPWLLRPDAAALEAAKAALSIDELVLASPVAAAARAVQARLAAGDGRRVVVVVRGPNGSGRQALARGLARTQGWPVVETTVEALGDPVRSAALRRHATWQGAAVSCDVGVALTMATATAMVRCDAPLFVISSGGGVEELVRSAEGTRAIIEIPVAGLDAEHAAELWQSALGPMHDVDLLAHAGRFQFSAERIGLAASLARMRARLQGEPRITSATLTEVCRALPSVSLSQLAEKLPCSYDADDLVVRAETQRELELMLVWSREGKAAFARWGLSRSVRRVGLACLFSGPPGTGKTLAAQVLARTIGLDLYRIDLSNVVSKYIGETEKNLGKLFDEAEQANAILFFDEADALFGKRTEIKDAHDRYANIETGFLLQRIETHPGICILATNLKRNVDEAFIRRLQIVAEFPMPDRAERLLIWRKHLPAPEHLDGDVDLSRLAAQFALSGAEIRNTVLTAALLAAAAGSRIGMPQLAQALWRELNKSGRVIDLASFGDWREHVLRYIHRERK
jgi:AAA+ superfamily predicted ATPase